MADNDRKDGTNGGGGAAVLDPPKAVSREFPAPVAPAPRELDASPWKLSKRERRRLRDANRHLDSWERYRALTDTIEEALDLVDLGDHKARFALVIMAALNVAIFFVATHLDLVGNIPEPFVPYVGTYLLVYATVALYFFLQAIESLRPRKEQPETPRPGQALPSEEGAVGLRFYEDILARDVASYQKSWRELRIGQLNSELALQLHALAAINKVKFAALRRLYRGLQIMTIMATVLVGLAALTSAVKPDKALLRGADVLGAAERVTGIGVREPSGIAFQESSGHLFVVGDEGSLVELDATGEKVYAATMEAQIEDVAVHTPSGNLVLLSEGRSSLVVYDPRSRKEVRRIALDTPALLGEAAREHNQGFEGLAFRPDPAQRGGGVFYLTHQRSPSAMVALSFDPLASPERLGAEAVVGRWPMPDEEDLTAVTWVPGLQRLLVIADSKDRLLVLTADGRMETDLSLPGVQQEGIAFDGQGALWIADDKEKILVKVPGALARLQSRLTTSAPAATPPAAGAARPAATVGAAP